MSDTQAIDRVLGDAVESGQVPGVTAAAANADGVFTETAFGRRSLAGDAPMTTDTVFRIASMTKAITGAAAMQLVERGKLSLDQPAGEILPFWRTDGAGWRRRVRRTQATARERRRHTAKAADPHGGLRL